MKRIKRLINSRALVRLHMIRIGIGRRFHSKQRVSRWYNQPIVNSILNLLSLLLLILAVLLSYRTLKESQNYGSSMITQLNRLSQLITKVNEQISYLPTGMQTFDSTIRRLDQDISNQQQEFQESIKGLKNNIDAFSKGIANYGNTLALIVEASDKQLTLLDSRQKLLEKELMRSPKLKVRVKECTEDTSGRLHIIPEIINEGDEIATKCGILLMVPSEFEFKSSSFIVSDSMADIQQWSCEYPSSIPFRKGEERLLRRYNRSISFSIKLIPNRKTPLKFTCYIAHDKGTDEDTLAVDPSKCH